MKIMVLTQFDNDATFFYRLNPLFYIDHSKIIVERRPYHGNICYSFFENFTHLILERPSGGHDLSVIKLAKQCGLYVITDWDDDCLHLDGYNPMFHTYEDAKQTVIDCINESDEVWVSTQGVKKSFQFFNRNIHVIPNAHNDYLFPVEQKRPFNPEGKLAFWRGGGSHEADVYEKAEDIVRLVNDNTDWKFYFIGCRFIYMEQRCGMNYQPVSLMPLMQYFNFLYDHNPQIVFHTLCDTRFNESKSNIAWIEATYAGAAFFGNTNLPEFGSVPGTQPFQHLDEYIPKDRIDILSQCNIESWTYICDNLLLSQVNKKREERLLS